VADFFANTKEFMLSAIYNPGKNIEGISTIDEITGSGRPVFNDNTISGIKEMGLELLLGHQHRNVVHGWGHEINTSFVTSYESPRVLLCSNETVEPYIIARNFKALFPEIAELQQYFHSLLKESRCKTFGFFLSEQFSSVKKEHETALLMRYIVIYLYACICDSESKTLLDNEKIFNFFENDYSTGNNCISNISRTL
jgi:hypothetical protein